MVRRLLGAVGVLVLGFVGAAIPPGAAVAGELPVEVKVYAWCDSSAGTWRMFGLVTNWTPVKAFIGEASDPVSNETLTFTATELASPGGSQTQWLVPGSRTASGLRVEIRRADRTQSQTFVEPLTMGACKASTPTPTCVTVADARFVHTFDGAAGTATVELVGPRLCEDEFQIFYLESWATEPPTGFGSYDLSSMGFSGASAARKLVMRVARPANCRYDVRLRFDMVGGGFLGDPRFIAGSTQSPGNRSTGPFASYTSGGTACTVGPNARILSYDCEGNITFLVSNAPGVNVAAVFGIQERSPGGALGVRQLTLEPGEKVRFTHRAQRPTDAIEIYWHGRLLVSARWAEPAKCRRDMPVKPAPSVTPSPVLRRR